MDIFFFMVNCFVVLIFDFGCVKFCELFCCVKFCVRLWFDDMCDEFYVVDLSEFEFVLLLCFMCCDFSFG